MKDDIYKIAILSEELIKKFTTEEDCSNISGESGYSGYKIEIEEIYQYNELSLIITRLKIIQKKLEKEIKKIIQENNLNV